MRATAPSVPAEAPAPAPAPAPAARAAPRDRVLLALLAALAVVQVVGVPKAWYPGDNAIARAEAVNLVEHGRLGFPLSAKPFGGFAAERGRYLFENDAKGLMYSKYGFAHTLLYVPVVAAARWIDGAPVQPLGGGATLFWVQVLYGALFAVGCGYWLYRLAASFTASAALRVAFVAASIYPSYAWHYLRAPTLEVFQIFFFLAFCVQGLAWLRAARAGPGAAGVGALAGAAASAAVLLMMRPTFGLLLPLVAVLGLVAGPEASLRGRVRGALTGRLRALLLAALPAVALVALWIAVNVVRTGSPLDSGYGQWVGADGLSVSRVTLEAVPDALRGFLAQAGNYDVFLHHPLLLVGLAGWPLLLRRWPGEARFLLAAALGAALPIFAASNWNGEWCYGPRYLVHAVLVLSVAAVPLAERLRDAPAPMRGGVAIAVAAGLAASLGLQLRMNGVHWFAYQYAQEWFSGRLGAPAAAWFEAPRLRPIAIGALQRFVRDGAPFPPVDAALADLPGPARERAREELRRSAAHLVEDNWGIGNLGRWASGRLRSPGRGDR